MDQQPPPPADLENKYQKLATEFSKVRSQVTVLKKALLEEQAKNVQLNDAIKSQEQTIRKREQEMESLTFRNDQLTKRISVLQQDLQMCTNNSKKGKKQPEIPNHNSFSVVDEELHKKIIENAQLASSLADKESELLEHKEKVQVYQEEIDKLQKKLADIEKSFKDEKKRNRSENNKLIESPAKNVESNCDNYKFWQAEVNKYKTELEKCKNELEILQTKPSSNDQVTDYYEKQIRQILQQKNDILSESKSLWADYNALAERLAGLTEDYKNTESLLEKSMEELRVTHENYKSQLDAMTEHLAAQNEKITRQTDDINMLKHKLSMKK